MELIRKKEKQLNLIQRPKRSKNMLFANAYIYDQKLRFGTVTEATDDYLHDAA